MTENKSITLLVQHVSFEAKRIQIFRAVCKDEEIGIINLIVKDCKYHLTLWYQVDQGCS